jgi:hypothetical protein
MLEMREDSFMSTGLRWVKFGGAVLLGAAVLCVGGLGSASAATSDQPQKAQKKSKKQQPQLPPLPSGPTGRPVQPIPLDATPAVPPQVTFTNNQLTIVAPNSTLADILRAVRKLTGAEIEIPSAPERVVTNLGPGPARSVVAELLNGSRFNYILLGSPLDSAALTRIVLVAKTNAQEPSSPAPALNQQANLNNQVQEQAQAQEAEAAEDSSDDNADQSEPEPPAAEQPQDQNNNNVKTPQQMLQEMQQRQMQMQQQQNQPPGPGRPPASPQQQDQ